MRGDRVVEVYGRREDGTLWFIGYAEMKPGAEWWDQHVSSVGSFKSVEWSAEHAAWIIDMERAVVTEKEPPAPAAQRDDEEAPSM
jgi:hypothetical protein